MAKPKTKRGKGPSYAVLAAARQLVEGEAITLKDMAGKLKMPPTSLAAMLAPGYSNMTLDRIDKLRSVVLDIRAKA